MIYTLHDIKRIAGEYIVKEFTENPSLAFCNTSFGGWGRVGEVLGSLVGKTEFAEYTVLYSMDRLKYKEDELIDCYQLSRHSEMQTFKKKKADGTYESVFERTYDNEVLLTLYELGARRGCGYIYTDDYAEAVAARSRHLHRIKSDTQTVSGEWVLTTAHAKYAHYYNLINFEIFSDKATGIKHGTPITVRYDRGCHKVYNPNIGKYVDKPYCDIYVRYTYRNKEYNTLIYTNH